MNNASPFPVAGDRGEKLKKALRKLRIIPDYYFLRASMRCAPFGLQTKSKEGMGLDNGSFCLLNAIEGVYGFNIGLVS